MFKKARRFVRICRFCDSEFMAADVKAAKCDVCKVCGCGAAIKKSSARTCSACRGGQHTAAQVAQRAKVHDATRESNPATLPGVGRKISKAISGDRHPSRKHPELWAKLARSMKPKSISRLELSAVPVLPDFEHQHRIGRYVVDFARHETKDIVEVHGCYWHSCQACFPGSPTTKQQQHTRRNDLARTAYLTKRGWNIAVLWEHDRDKWADNSD